MVRKLCLVSGCITEGGILVKGSMYWRNDQLTALRRECLAARRESTRSKGDAQLHEEWKRQKQLLHPTYI